MNKTIKILLIILGLIVFATVLHFTPPLDEFASRIPLIKDLYGNSVLTVSTPRGRATVFVDGTEHGQTPLTLENLNEGRYLIELEKITETPELYEKQQFYVNLHRNTETIINIEIAPDNFKSGYILSYAPAPRDTGYLTIQSDLQNYEIFLNDEAIAQEKLTSYKLDEGEYTLKIASSGYESIEFPVIVRKGYNLNATIYLLPIPIIFD